MFTRARLRLTAWYVALISVTIAALGVTAYVLIRQDLDAEINDSLNSAMAQLLGSVQPAQGTGESGRPETEGDDDDDDERDESAEEDVRAAGLPSDIFYVVFDVDGALIANPRRVNLDAVNLAALASAAETNGRVDAGGDGARYRLTVTRWPAETNAFLAVGRSLQTRDHQLRTIALLFVAGGIAGLAFAAASGFLLAGRTLNPIQRSFETQRRFISDASHELRTPLTIARVHASLLTEDGQASVESKLEHVEAITTEIERMTALVGGLLTLARADEGRANLVMQEVDFANLARDVAHDMEALAELRGVELRVDTQPAIARGDSGRLRQLLVILIDNALKYTPDGGSATVRCRGDGRHVELAVSDTGAGIPAEEQRHIFERFYRADAARSRGTGGTGLGLSIAAWIAEAHDGHISVQSEPGQGATFRVRLPRG